MKIDRKMLRELLEANPQVDAGLVMQAVEESEDIRGMSEGMVNFNLKLPYSSDNFDRAVQNSWNVV